MSSRHSSECFTRIIQATVQAFIESNSYSGVHIEDIAQLMKVPKSTVYQYAQSKSALFDLAILYADAEAPFDLPEVLPVPVPPPGQTLRTIRARMEEHGRFERLRAAIREPAQDTFREMSDIIGDIYDIMSDNRSTVRLLSASARDQCDIAAIWYDGARVGLLHLLREYLRGRHAAGVLTPTPSVTIQARMLIETMHWFAVDRHWDLRPDDLPDELVRDTIVQNLTRGFFGPSG